MFAFINLPGSRHFQYYGPASKADCKNWLEKTRKSLLRTELLTSTLPYGLISNKEAAKVKYRDGSNVYRIDSLDNCLYD
jgi:hypothetical protein